MSFNGVDLARFQFDYDQTWAVLFMHPDGTVYGRYGTRAGNRDRSTTHISVAGLTHAMQRALQLHARYPANRAALSGKQPRPVPVRYAAQFSWLRKRTQQNDATKRCVHCHMVGSSLVRWRWERGQLTERDLFAYPLPEAVGMKMRRDDDLVIASVQPGSPADRAGLRRGDRVVRLDGQPLISQADIQWILHGARDGTHLELEYARSGRQAQTVLRLPQGQWRRGNLTWRELAWHLRPGMRVRPASQAVRLRLGIPPGRMALEVDMVFRWDPRARRAGIRKGDVIIEADGRRDLLTEEAFLAQLWLNHGPGDRVPVTVRRGERLLQLQLSMAWHPQQY